MLEGRERSENERKEKENEKLTNSVVEPEPGLQEERARQGATSAMVRMDETYSAYEDCPVVGEG